MCMLVWLSAAPARAANIDLNIQQVSVNDQVMVHVHNASPDAVVVTRIAVLLHGLETSLPVTRPLEPDERREFMLQVELPPLRGSFPLVVTVSYLNEGAALSLKDVGLFNHLDTVPLALDGGPRDAVLHDEGVLVVESSDPDAWNLILPDEISLDSTTVEGREKRFHVTVMHPRFRTTYPLVAVAEREDNGIHSAVIRTARLSTGEPGADNHMRGRLSEPTLLVMLLVSAAGAALSLWRSGSARPGHVALTKLTVRVFFFSASYLLLKCMPTWLDAASNVFPWPPAQNAVLELARHFRGTLYDAFFRYAVDLYFAVALVASLIHQLWFDKDVDLHEDKYVALFRTLLSLAAVRPRKIYWDVPSRLGLLALMVKIFYVPYLVSWTINNAFHQANLTESFVWTFEQVNAYAVALFIYIDTTVFAFGYMFESSLLRSNIKSVDPTLLGWVVCLWCYPPFNDFSFKLFDHQLFDIQVALSDGIKTTATVVVTVLWGIFAGASVALGFKASNLTNRGVVRAGPYRYVRHPAYAAKLAVCYIEGFVFGKYFIGLMLGMTLIYVLRAWTEERHLSTDPDYRSYCAQVKYRFIPGII